VVTLLVTPSGRGHPVLFRDASKKGMIPSNSALPHPNSHHHEVPDHDYNALGGHHPIPCIPSVDGHRHRRRRDAVFDKIISTSSLSREISRLSFPLYDGFGGRDDAHNSMPPNDKIAMQKRKAYAVLSSFHETLSSLPNASLLLLMSSLRMWLMFRGLGDEYNKSSSSSLSRHAEYWSCIDRAMLYAVPMDPAAGIGIGRPSRQYRCTVSVMADIDVNGGGGGGGGVVG
jgi:hypothetical protein